LYHKCFAEKRFKQVFEIRELNRQRRAAADFIWDGGGPKLTGAPL